MVFEYLGISVMEVSSSSALSDNDSVGFYGGIEVSSSDSERTLDGGERSVSYQHSTGSGVDGES